MKRMTGYIRILTFLSLLGALAPMSLGQDVMHRPITIHAERCELRQVLEDISSQSGIQFVFCDAMVDGKEVSVSFDGLDLAQGLKLILDPLKLVWRPMEENLVVLFNADVVSLGKKTERKKPENNPPTLHSTAYQEYPRLAQFKGLEGTVDLNLLIDKEGNVNDAKVVESSGYMILDNAAMTFVRKLKFNPAKQAGMPVPVWISWSLKYELRDSQIFQMEPFNTIESLRNALDQSPGDSMSHVILVDAYLEGIRYLMAQNNLYFNTLLKRFMNSESFDPWSEFRNDVPLYFLLMHDYISLYPTSPLRKPAEQLLVDFMQYVLDSISIANLPKSMDHEQVLRFHRLVDQFMNHSYPEMAEAIRHFQ